MDEGKTVHSDSKNNYTRLLLKLSGETLSGPEGHGVDYEACRRLAHTLKDIQQASKELGIVIGGGNIFRGINVSGSGMQQTPADHMGMLATLINGVALQEALESVGCEARVMTALECPRVAESYSWRKAHEYLNKGIIVIFVGGTGNPYFTTDTAAALRANEIHADILLKATKVDGIYSDDPLVNPQAVRYETISYSRALDEQLKIMDATAFALCMSHSIPIFVFNMANLYEHTITEILSNKNFGTFVKED